jgi:8-oxo-dGTP pyrophosphatase MutT (NUDIX family)
MLEVVTCLLENNGKILILRRSEKVKTYKGLWSGISGYVEEDPLDTAFKEIKEEVGIEKEFVQLLKRADPLEFIDYYKGKKYHWKVYPFLFRLKKIENIHLDWENVDYRWILPREIKDYRTVPRLKEVFSLLVDGEKCGGGDE